MRPPDHETVSLAITNRHPRMTISEELLRQAVHAVCAAERIASADISLVLTDDAEIHRINAEFLGHDYPTDVISFSLDAADDDPLDAAQESPVLQGELIVSLDTARQVAAAQGWSLEAEVVLYVVHGLLHLCGYEDETDEARLIMRKREREILSGLSLPAGEDPSASGWDKPHS